MKQFISILCAVLFTGGIALAQQAEPAPQPQPSETSAADQQQVQQTKKTRTFPRLQFGIRGGINGAHQQLPRIQLGDGIVTAGAGKLGYEVGVALRLNLSKVLHLQSELNYNFVNYGYRISDISRRDVTLRTERLEVPVQVGLQLGALRLFGGAMFRLAQTQHSNGPSTFKVRFNDDDIALTGGVGLNIRKFFLDFRVTGFPFSNSWNQFSYDGASKLVKVKRNIVYGGSIGFFF